MSEVTLIKEEAFMDCSALTDISFPEATEIVHDAFKGCPTIDFLKSVTPTAR